MGFLDNLKNRLETAKMYFNATPDTLFGFLNDNVVNLLNNPDKESESRRTKAMAALMTAGLLSRKVASVGSDPSQKTVTISYSGGMFAEEDMQMTVLSANAGTASYLKFAIVKGVSMGGVVYSKPGQYVEAKVLNICRDKFGVVPLNKE